MNKSDYNQNMEDILADVDTYQPVRVGTGLKQAATLKQRVRQVLLKPDRGKRLLHLLPDNPRLPRAYGHPKTHKPGIPL